MKRAFHYPLRGFDGNHISIREQGTDPQGEPAMMVTVLTLASVCITVLIGDLKGEAGISGQEKFDRFQLAERIHNGMAAGRAVDITAEELTLLKRLVPQMYTPAVVGPAYRALETDLVVVPVGAPEPAQVVELQRAEDDGPSHATAEG